MEWKYEVRKDHRIVALRDGPWGPAGTVGGFLLDKALLSHEGECWIYDNAVMRDKALMRGHAVMSDCAAMYDNAVMSDGAVLCGNVGLEGDSARHGRSSQRTPGARRRATYRSTE